MALLKPMVLTISPCTEELKLPNNSFKAFWIAGGPAQLELAKCSAQIIDRRDSAVSEEVLHVQQSQTYVHGPFRTAA